MHYFAYGSNLWLQQMARRCPRSRFIGCAVLVDYRWQINERGFANVVRCSGSSVHGLVFDVNADDEARLDRNEGVGSGAYSKAYLDVVLHPAARGLRKSLVSVVSSRVASSYRNIRERPPSPVLSNVLVYLSEDYVRAGVPREEYIHRINAGILDAIAFDVPPAFFENVVRPLVPAEADHHLAQGPARSAAVVAPSSTALRGSTQNSRRIRQSPSQALRQRTRNSTLEMDGRTRSMGWGAFFPRKLFTTTSRPFTGFGSGQGPWIVDGDR